MLPQQMLYWRPGLYHPSKHGSRTMKRLPLQLRISCTYSSCWDVMLEEDAPDSELFIK
jgi:hypothetical protein